MALSAVSQRLSAKSATLLVSLDTRLDRIMQTWLLVAGLACAARIAFSPMNGPIGLDSLLPYILLILAPFASIVLALRWFADGDRQAQPEIRGPSGTLEDGDAMRGAASFALWRGRDHGFAACWNAHQRAFSALEYLGAMPAITGVVPPWLDILHTMMTLDVVLMSSLYAIAFVAALRHAPMFPRLVVAIWGLDLTMQLVTAELVAGTPGLPVSVAEALHNLLDGNVKKVLISIGLWLPYLLLSSG